MKKNFFALLLTGLAAVAFTSCQKDNSMHDLQPEKEKSAAAKKSNVLRLQRITIENSPYMAFRYDQKGRISSASSSSDSTTYVYRAGGLEIRTISKFTKQVTRLLNAKLGGNGYISQSTGFNIASDGEKTDFKDVYTYNGLGQLTGITRESSANGGPLVTHETSFEWNDGNLIKKTDVFKDWVDIAHYQYDLSKKDQTGLWNLITGTWADSFFGKRSTNHISGISAEKDGDFIKFAEYTWQVNTAGYATVCTWKLFSGFPDTGFHYHFQ